MKTVELKSVAKINLDLRVLHKNPDGFHELRTVFQTISLHDLIRIEFEAARKTELSIDDALQIPDNLILRAARAVLKEAKVHAKVRFALKKRIPMGGGLGGGSSNAAAVLLALPVLAGRPVAMEKLIEIGGKLGSDVPFFLMGGTALGLGRGTELYPLKDVSPEPALIVAPGVHVATGPAYQALGRGLTFTGTSSSINSFQAFVRALGESGSAREANAFGANDFEPVVLTQYPQLHRIAGKLRKCGAKVRMTGSGSAFFALFDTVEEARRVEKVVESNRALGSVRVMPARLVNRAGYARMWRRQLAPYLADSEKEQDAWPPRSR